jgi:hypothetical protein
MMRSHVARAQIESELVDFVRDLRMGDNPRRAKYIRIADLNVFSRAWTRQDNEGENLAPG